MISYKEFERTFRLYTLLGESVFNGNENVRIIKFFIDVSDTGYVIKNLHGNDNYYGYRYDDVLMFTYSYSDQSVVFSNKNFFVYKLFNDMSPEEESYKYSRLEVHDFISEYLENFLDLKKKEKESIWII